MLYTPVDDRHYSSFIAYGTGCDQVGTASLADLPAGRPDVATAVRARRGRWR